MKMANKIIGTKAGGPRQLPMWTRWAARVAPLCHKVTAGRSLSQTIRTKLAPRKRKDNEHEEEREHGTGQGTATTRLA
jgi:hypothetical protein